jgi:hypothetical protein
MIIPIDIYSVMWRGGMFKRTTTKSSIDRRVSLGTVEPMIFTNKEI